MNRRLTQLLDKLQILNIYLVSAFDLSLPGKVVFALSFIVYFVLLVNNLKFSKLTVQYISIVSATFLFLLLSSLLRGNELNNALKFIIPLFILFNIFIYEALSREYSLDRYIFHYYVVSVLISLKILLLFFLFVNGLFYDYLPIANAELDQPTWIAANYDGIRIFVGQATLIPIGLLFSYYLYGKMPYVLLLISIISLALTQTTVLWVTYCIVLIYLINKQFAGLFKYLFYLLFAIALIILGVVNFDLLTSVYFDKITHSAPVKFQQIYIALEALGSNLFFGGGLGYLFPNGSNTIEVVPLHILSTTGIVGCAVYSFMLFYWLVISYRFVKADEMTNVLFLSYISIVFASLSNPYLIGGNSGLFLIPIIAARFLRLKGSQKKIHAVRGGVSQGKNSKIVPRCTESFT